jgi:hypothetical protein
MMISDLSNLALLILKYIIIFVKKESYGRYKSIKQQSRAG